MYFPTPTTYSGRALELLLWSPTCNNTQKSQPLREINKNTHSKKVAENKKG